MPNDAKFGLIVGLTLVLSAAILFFQKEQPATSAPRPAISTPSAAPSTAAMLPPPAPLPRPGVDRDVPGQTASRLAGMW